MRAYYFLFISIGLSQVTFSQNTNETIQDRDSIECFYVFNNDTLLQINYGYYKPRFQNKRKLLLRINERILDSTGLRFNKKPTIYQNKLIGSGSYNSNRVQLEYHIPMKKITVVNDPQLILSASEFPIGLENRGDTIPSKILTIANNRIVVVADFENILRVEEPPGIPEEICSIHHLENEHLLVETAFCNGGCYSYSYYLISNREILGKKFDEYQLKGISEVYEEFSKFRINIYFSHSEFDFLIASVDYGNLPEDTDLIFSKNLEDTTQIIKKHPSWEIVGENIQNGKNQFFYMRSRLDNGEKVIISNRIEQLFEKISYQIFTGQIIVQNQIEGFNSEQLSILKNLAFAKHNYAFNSDFYQAYFNLFDFYNNEEKRASRTKNMDGLLTASDLKNLEIINKALEKF
ncbi:MAG: YARHG domain-containing protein [Bacteroidota bacterium]